MPLRHLGESSEDYGARVLDFARAHPAMQNPTTSSEVDYDFERTTNPFIPNPFRTEFVDEVEEIRQANIQTLAARTKIAKKLHLSDRATLKEATRILLRKYQPAEGQTPRPQADRRERDYIAIIQNQISRSKTPRELLYSEKPLYVSYLGHDVLKEMQPMCSDIQRAAGGFVVKCSVTREVVPNEFAFICAGRVYSADHVPAMELCAGCEFTRSNCKPFTTYDNHSIFVCDRCVDSQRCGRCSSELKPEYIEAGMCSSCVESGFMDRPFRNYYRGQRWSEDESVGAIMESPRIFSFEMEAVIKRGMTDTLGESLPPDAGVSGDSSISSGLGVGVEVQSPLLKGKKGEEFVARVASSFKAVKGEVNDSCGMHVHLDAYDILPKSRQDYPKALVDLWKAHLIFEDVLFSFLPFTRRLNRFCRPMRDYFKVSEIEMIETMFDAEKLWYKQQDYDSIRSEKQHHHHASRYFGVNFHSLFGSNNLELRHHSGTLNAKKVLQWANLHSLIMDAAAHGVFTSELLANAQATTNIRDKTNILFELIGLSNKSKQYFLQRQNKFNNKEQNEDGLTPMPQRERSRNILPGGFMEFPATAPQWRMLSVDEEGL